MLVKAAILWTVLLLLKDNLKILYKIRNTDTDFSSYAKMLMLGSKVEANRLCALYLRRCEERKESKEGQLPEFKALLASLKKFLPVSSGRSE